MNTALQPSKRFVPAWAHQTSQSLSAWISMVLEDGKQKNAIAVLDGVRAIACLSVLFFHLNFFARETYIWRPILDLGSIVGALALAGQSGVTLFFVLSGFLLFMPYAKSLLFDKEWPSMRLFYMRRAFRIIPAYYASLFLMILLFHPEYLQADHWHEIVLFLTFFMDAPQTYQHINGPFWTLAVEAQFYMLLPLLALGIRFIVQRGVLRQRVITLSACLLAVIIWGVLTRYYGYYYSHNPNQTLLLPRSVTNTIMLVVYGTSGKYLEDFGIGMLISFCYIFSQNLNAEGRWNILLRRLSPVLWWVGLGELFFMALWHFNIWYYHYALHFLDPLVHYYDQWNEIGCSIGYGLCIIAILFGSRFLKRPFEWSPLRWIGLISYSLYMWHVPLLSWYASTIITPYMHGWRRSLEYGLFWCWALLVIIPFSFLCYVWLEKPWIQLGEKLRRNSEKRKAEKKVVVVK